MLSAADSSMHLKSIVSSVIVLVSISLVGCSNASDSTSDIASGDDALRETAQADSPITISNFISHPKIVAIRKFVSEVDKGGRKGTLTRARRDNLCEGIGDASREKLSDTNGKIRRLFLSYGSDDSAGQETHYYTEAGKLRFSYFTSSDVFGRARQVRRYYDEGGQEIFSVLREATEAHAPGTFEPSLDKARWKAVPSDAIETAVTDAATAFELPAACE